MPKKPYNFLSRPMKNEILSPVSRPSKAMISIIRHSGLSPFLFSFQLNTRLMHFLVEFKIRKIRNIK